MNDIFYYQSHLFSKLNNFIMNRIDLIKYKYLNQFKGMVTSHLNQGEVMNFFKSVINKDLSSKLINYESKQSN